MPSHSPPNELPSWFIIKVTAIASLGGVLFGYDMGAVAGALPQLAETFDLEDSQKEWVVSILYLGGGVGACVGGALCDWGGRQRTILGTDIVFILGATWLYFANSYAHVLLGRFVVGVGVAVSGIADVSYLSEVAPSEWRGAIVSVNEACISLGFLLAYVAGYAYQLAENEEWRIIFGWAGVVALVQLLGMWSMPESPVWLAEQGRMEESRRAWQQINHGHSPVEEQNDEPLQAENNEPNIYQHAKPLEHDPASQSIPSEDSSRTWVTLVQHSQALMLTLSRYRRQIYIAIFLAITQQLCGQTNVLNYAPFIFAEAAGEEDPPAWSTLAIGFVKFFVTVLVILRIEFWGRRTLLIGGMALISIGLFALIVAFGGSGNDPDSWSTNLRSFELALPGVLLVVCGYSISFGPLTWLLTSELFPTDIRGRALGALTIVTYLVASFVTRTFLSAQSALGPSKVFALYCIINTGGIIFAWLAIPDTAEKSAEEVEAALPRMWWWRYDHLSLFADEGTTSSRSFTRSSSGDETIRIEMGSHQSLPELI